MKKVLLPLLILMAFSMLLAIESAPSEIVGYVKYPSVTGLNFIALPMQSGYAWASDLGNANMGTMDIISYWDATMQNWVSASDLGGFYDGDFEVATGAALMINAMADFNLYSMGTLPAAHPTYSMITGLNSMMVPLNQSSLAWASDVGIAIGTVDIVSNWDASLQNWVSASDLGGFYDGDFAVAIGMPLMVNSFSATTWPGARSSQTPRAQRASK